MDGWTIERIFFLPRLKFVRKNIKIWEIEVVDFTNSRIKNLERENLNPIKSSVFYYIESFYNIIAEG